MLTKEMLRSLREQKGLTGKQVAEGIGIAYPVYQTYESGARNAGLPVVEKLADFYGVTTDYLLGREPAPDPFGELRIDPNDEKAVLDRYMSFPPQTRAVLLDALRQLAGLYQFLKNLIPLEDEDDVFCEELYRAYEQDDDPEKHETVTLEELAKELGQDIA